jgi:DNA-directed RNA polymerase subunit RPC12/RpoP
MSTKERNFNISLPLTEDNYLARQCFNCKRKFSIKADDYDNKGYLNLRCPYCGLIGEFEEFLTDEQNRWALSIQKEEAKDLVLEMLDNNFENISTNKGNISDSDRNSPHISKEMGKFRCDKCDFRIKYNQRFDEKDILCPVCRN